MATIRRKVKRVIDKDTFETYTKIQGTNRVRIAGMDGAELDTALGRRQRDQMKKKIQGKVVTLFSRLEGAMEDLSLR